MKKNKIKPHQLLILLLIAAFILPGCTKDDDSNAAVDSITAKTWTLKYIQNTHSHFINYYPDISKDITIDFTANKQLFFHGICNEGNGNFAVENDKLTISSLIITDIYCDNIEWESITGTNLRNASRFELAGNKLIIYSKGDFNLVFE